MLKDASNSLSESTPTIINSSVIFILFTLYLSIITHNYNNKNAIKEVLEQSSCERKSPRETFTKALPTIRQIIYDRLRSNAWWQALPLQSQRPLVRSLRRCKHPRIWSPFIHGQLMVQVPFCIHCLPSTYLQNTQVNGRKWITGERCMDSTYSYWVELLHA